MMYPSPLEHNQQQSGVPGSGLKRILFRAMFLVLAVYIACIFAIGQTWRISNTSEQPMSPAVGAVHAHQSASTQSPQPSSSTYAPLANQVSGQNQSINAYIDHMTQTQKIGQLLMLPVYTNGYNSALNQPLQQWDIANVIIFTQYGGALMPSTQSGLAQLGHDLQAHANQRLIVATDDEGGTVDRLAPYYGSTPSPGSLAATGNTQQVYAQARQDAQRLLANGINANFAPLVDVYQGGAIGQSRMFGSTPGDVIKYAGAFLDGLQQNGVQGTLKHWPGLGSASANPDNSLATITHSQSQLNSTDFAPFRALLSHQPGMIMTTHVMVPAYDSSKPASLSPVLINQVLRGQLGYQGVVVTDQMEAGGLLQSMQKQGYSDPSQAIAEATVQAILAGNDIVECPMAPDRLAAVVNAVTSAVQSGRISQDRLNQSVQRILALKARMGLISLS
ncbi:glycoside hydrolase family 3 protein [Dictyobacter kobayashii]|uniref:beta-N-acetylhexosaminidase n=1 Tax=Dictyobacter kobayashii TaxID=2014872 RepID=A0A402ASD9_9CHLR|nr:glycoside hydrolase family 3 N-terminal domain-containing protein [Dictyobacter kobayashii]GCE22015.1 hypothetical protein KDK_58150 [Dictyobacter kobayashii]